NRARREYHTQSGAHTATVKPRKHKEQTDRMCTAGCDLSRCAGPITSFLRSVCVAARRPNCGISLDYPGGHRRLKAAFFCLLFFAAAKKSRCRPAQGQRMKQENKTRMPAQQNNSDCVADKQNTTSVKWSY